MKAQPEVQISGHCLTKPTDNRVNKSGRRDRDFNHEEMQSLLAKLKDLVPNMPKNKKLSKLEIIQYVIDYILDLQNALEAHPAARPTHISGSSTSPTRQPLGVLPPSSNTVVNTCGAQEVSHTDKVPSHLSDLVVVSSSRPVSC